MGTDRIDAMRKRIADAVGRMLPDRLAPRTAEKSHAIHDALWGMVSLRPHEITLLDSALLQRLHRLRQLGSAYMIFPGANHTRFEHTLGVMHLAGRICAELNSRRPGTVSAEQEDNLRFAALCHDLGHGPFSHCSESFFAGLDPMPGLLEGSGSGAAELLSIEIVRSAPFRRLLRRLNREYGTGLDADFIAAAIGGALPAKQRYLGEIIHGPCDADKLDYLNRDSEYCGLQSRVDVERIIRLLDVAPTSEGERLVVRHGALPALTQLLHNRSHLFAVVYQHNAARSFTAMLQSALRLAARSRARVCGRRLAGPADLIDLYDDWLVAPGSCGGAAAAALFDDVRDRRLYKTAVTIEDRLLDEGQRELFADDAMRGGLAARLVGRCKDLEAHEVIIDPGVDQANSEALEMLVGDGRTQIRLGEALELEDRRIPLHGFIKRHLILCPARARSRVAAAAERELKGLVPGRALR